MDTISVVEELSLRYAQGVYLPKSFNLQVDSVEITN